jgi:hypothetical protein
MDMITRTLLAVGLLAAAPSYAAYERTLTTASYVVTISVNCEEGTVDCDDVDYIGVSRKNGLSIKLHGRDLTHYCPGDQGDGPGKTPCQHWGHVFRNGPITYEAWNNGQLLIWRSAGPKKNSPRKVLLDERGTWTSPQERPNSSLHTDAPNAARP